MQALRRLYAKLHLRVNEAKSAVAPVQDRKFLGYTFWLSSKNEVRCTIARKALDTMKDRVRHMTSRMRGRSVAQVCQDLRVYLPGWRNYFQLVEFITVFRELDRWIRHRLRATYRYARTIELRAPSHGWFILRGRRGHYRFSDEVRAYDLATGAAYVARSEAALALGGVGVDFEATDADRKVEAFSGNVLVDALRELAFVALTARALGPARSEMTLVPVPRSLRVEVSDRPAGFVYDIPEPEWGSSEQTALSFALIDEGKSVADGAFTWPYSSFGADQRAADVLVALEAGLEHGCPRASLPRAVGAAGS